MVVFSSFEELKVRDSENLISYFTNGDEAVRWVNTVNSGGREWIEKRNKQHWELIKFVSIQRGIINEDCTRKTFANILITFCPDAVSAGESFQKLATSMAHYAYVGKLKQLDKVFETHLVRTHIKDAEDFLDNVPTMPQGTPSKPSIADRMEAYLRTVVEQGEDKYPISKLVVKPQYEDVCPALSIEIFVNRQFFEQKLPSQIVAFEILDKLVDDLNANALVGKYSNMKNIKLFIVSPKGLTPDVKKTLLNHGVGFVCISEAREISENSYVLPRVSKGEPRRFSVCGLRSISEMLQWENPFQPCENQPKEEPLSIADNEGESLSLVDVLKKYNVKLNGEQIFVVPYLKTEEIEAKANELTSGIVEGLLNEIRDKGLNPLADYSVNPFEICRRMGLKSEGITMDNSLLGRFVPSEHVIQLNTSVSDYYPRYRFTMAHELGHHVLHSKIFEDSGTESVQETEITLSLGASQQQKLEIQANLFASYLLMPQKLVVVLYKILFDIFVTQRYGDSFHPLYYSEKQSETWPSYNDIVRNMARILDVSEEALTIRLKDLNLMNVKVA